MFRILGDLNAGINDRLNLQIISKSTEQIRARDIQQYICQQLLEFF
jgi:hypothetical protein